MHREIHGMKDLGTVIRAVRKSQGIRQDELATMIPASHVFIIDVERGKPSAQIGKVLDLLRELGIKVSLDIPNEAAAHLEEKASKGSGVRRRG